MSEANRAGILQGQSDYPLAREGIKAVIDLIEYWKSQDRSFDHLISSPLQRAKGTAELIAEQFDLSVEYDEIWKERHYGEAENATYDQVHERYPGGPNTSPFELVFGSGESEWDLHIRASIAVRKIILLDPGNYLIVSHGGFLGAVLRSILGIAPTSGRTRPIRFSFENTGFAELRYNHGEARWYVDCLNSLMHKAHTGE
jgi:broad specificity phosphatase PhoE